ncbi:MAG: toll/interleukin-1 receptor domain-containing protein [Thiothrix sp.]|nr:MAG: toll/interleukin-1 receptor domain-containing protein [Thiothrix sp.]
MPKIFISYSHDESSFAAELHEKLQEAGFDVFFDAKDIKLGDEVFDKLNTGLDTSDAMLLVVSDSVQNSVGVQNEFSVAQEKGLPVIPVIAENVRTPLWLRHLQTVDFSEGKNWSLLLDRMNLLLVQGENLSSKSTLFEDKGTSKQ